jgi:hypothetical protein
MRVRTVVALFLTLVASAALAQNWPMPASSTQPTAFCFGCTGFNASGQPNAGLPTVAYPPTLLDHTGRVVDSYDTINVQNSGIRTVRARAIHLAPAGDRIYIALGEAVGAYTLDTFFTSKLPGGMQGVDKILTGNKFAGRIPFERAVLPDSFFYPEADPLASGWTTTFVDIQRTLGEFDADDRGLFYGASRHLGWGIHRDDRRTDGRHMPFLSQVTADYGSVIFAFDVNGTYYAFVGDGQINTGNLYNVTDPRFPSRVTVWSDDEHRILDWSRHAATRRIATVDVDRVVHIYSYESFAAGLPAEQTIKPASRRDFEDAAFDEDGVLWLAESSTSGTATNLLWKVYPDGTIEKLDVYGAGFKATRIHAGAGYVAVGGSGSSTGTLTKEVRLFKVEGMNLTPIDTGHFFTKYYHAAPSGFANPDNNVELVDFFLISHAGRTYFIFNANGLGDVFELPQNNTLPSVEWMSPLIGPPSGATTVTIHGQNFNSGAKVTFDGIDATCVVVDSNTISAVAPPHAPGEVDVVVTQGTRSMRSPQKFTFFLAPPENLRALGSGDAAVALNWTPPPGAVQYDVQRRAPAGNWLNLARATDPAFVDPACGANQACVYRVRAVDAAEFTSDYTPPEAGVTVPLAATITPGMAVTSRHVTDLQAAVNALRASANLPATSFAPIAPGAAISASNVLTLRTSLNEARSALDMELIIFTDGSLDGQVIKAIHLQELIDGAI